MDISLAQLGTQWIGPVITGLYQGLLVTVAVAAISRLLPRANATGLHLFHFFALLLVAALPCLHLAWSNPPDRAVFPTTAVNSLPLIPPDRPLPVQRLASTRAASINPEPASPQEPRRTPSRLEPDPEPPKTLTPVPLPAIKPATQELSAGIVPVPATAWRRDWRIDLPHQFVLAAVMVWWFWAAYGLARLGWQSFTLTHWKRRGTAPPADLQRLFDRLGQELALRRPVKLCVIAQATGPMVVGYFRPAILVPGHLVETMQVSDWEPVLRHELAHVARLDDWTNLSEQVLKAVWFFHPGVHWLCRRLGLYREIACDDHVLAATRQGRRYAKLLAELACRNRDLPRGWTTAPAAWNHHSQLKQRIDMILNPHRNASPRLARAKTGMLITLPLMLALAAWQGAPRLALAQADAPPAQNQNRTGHSDPETPRGPGSAAVTTTAVSVASPRLPSDVPEPPQPPAPPQTPTPPAPPFAAAADDFASSAPVKQPDISSHDAGWGDTARRPDGMEARLEKLERMVERLLDAQSASRDDATSFAKEPFVHEKEENEVKRKTGSQKRIFFSPADRDHDVVLDVEVESKLYPSEDSLNASEDRLRERKASEREIRARAEREVADILESYQEESAAHQHKRESLLQEHRVHQRIRERDLLKAERDALRLQLQIVEQRLHALGAPLESQPPNLP